MTQRTRLVPEVARMLDHRQCSRPLGIDWITQDDYRAVIAASPNGGCVTDADLERAAVAMYAATCMKSDPTASTMSGRSSRIT